MFRNITIGQYYHIDSIIHRLDPRTKLFGTMVYIVTLMLAKNPVGYVLAAAFLAVYITLSKVPLKYILRGLKPIIMLLMVSVIFNLFLTKGETVLVSFWIFTITWQGLVHAFFMACRLIMLIIGSSIMTFTTTPNELTDGLETSLGFLRVIKIPVHEVAMMMSIALRFIPILVEETDKIMKAQMARGADFENGNLIQRAKNMIPLLVPLFISAFRRASDLAMAMESRCYHGGKGRTKMKPLKYKKQDGITYLLYAFYTALVIVIRMI